jgi:predicted nuclease of predicted toxin-antitoxin system
VARLYTDENVPFPIVELLQALSHNVLTAQEAGQANQKISDEAVLAFAIQDQRAIVTGNRRDYMKLHRLHPNHAGIIIYTEDLNFEQLANRLHEAICNSEPLNGKLIRVNRPAL